MKEKNENIDWLPATDLYYFIVKNNVKFVVEIPSIIGEESAFVDLKGNRLSLAKNNIKPVWKLFQNGKFKIFSFAQELDGPVSSCYLKGGIKEISPENFGQGYLNENFYSYNDVLGKFYNDKYLQGLELRLTKRLMKLAHDVRNGNDISQS